MPNATNYDAVHIHQGPGDLWVITTGVPADGAAPQLTLTGGIPDNTAHANSVHLGFTASAITTMYQPKLSDIKPDQATAPVDRYLVEEKMSLEAELSQLDPTIIQQCVQSGVFATASGYNQLTFGGLNSLSSVCVACIAPKRAVAGKYIVSLLFKAHGMVGLSTAIGRAKESSFKATFDALADLARTAGRQMGVVYETK